MRALEGEIARTIQQISGIAAARVHIVMPERGSFRRTDQTPTASVMIRASATVGRNAAASIRHLVASSVPGLNVDDVTILDSTGQLLATGTDPANNNLNQSLTVVQSVQGEIENNIDKALAPFLGMDNFRASVMANLNTDSQQIQETIFDPESRVERSTRVTKEDTQSSRQQADNAATVQQNVPQAAPAGGAAGPQSSDQAQKKEEQTNYEINQKTVATTKNSYKIEKLSVAVVVNKGRIATMLGEGADQAKIDAYLQEMQKIVASAAGLDTARGDVVTLTAMDFVDNQLVDEPVAGPGVMAVLTQNLGGIINAVAFLAVAFLVVWLGLRPLARSVGLGTPAGIETESAGLELPDFSPLRPVWPPVGRSWKASAPTSASTAPTTSSASTRTPPAASTAGSRKVPNGACPAWWRSARNAPPRSSANGPSTAPRKARDPERSIRHGPPARRALSFRASGWRWQLQDGGGAWP